MLANQQAAISREWLDVQDGVAIPADPQAAVQLQLLASSHVTDLNALAGVIRNDAGLMLQLLQFSARKLGKNAGSATSLEELVVLLGLEQLQAMAAQVTVTPPIHRHH